MTIACRNLSIWIVLLVLFLANRATSAPGPSATQKQVKEVSDAFMGDVIANRISDAVGRYEPSTLAIMGPDGIERQFIKRAFDSCGRPLDSQVENGGKPVTGEEVFSDGRN